MLRSGRAQSWRILSCRVPLPPLQTWSALAVVLAVVTTLAVGGSAAAQEAAPRIVALTPAPEEVLPAVDAALDIGIHLPDGPSAITVLVDGLQTVDAQPPAEPVPAPPSGGATMWFQATDGARTAPGVHQLEIRAPDGTTVSTWPFAISGFGRSHLAGSPDEVAADVAGRVDAGPDLVLVGAGAEDDTASALALAGASGGAIGIITSPSLTAATAAQVDDAVRRGGSVTVIGGTARVPQSVLDQIRERIGDAIPLTVIAASSREITAATVAAYQIRSVERPSRVVITSPRDLATSLPAGVLAAREGAMLVLTGPDRLPPHTRELLRANAPHLTSALLVGDAVATGRVAAEVRGILGDPIVEVLPQDPAEGAEGTALAASARMGGRLVVVSPDQPADALAAGLLAARDGGVAFVGSAARLYLHEHPAAAPLVIAAGVAESAAHDLWAVGIDGIEGPSVTVRLPDGPGLDLVLTADRPLDGAALTVTLTDGTILRDVPGQVVVVGSMGLWQPTDIPVDLPRELELTARIVGVAVAGVHARHLSATGPITLPPATTTSPEGFIVAGGTGPVVGTGPLRTYSVEIEPGTGLDITDVARQVEAILSDGRGWTATGARSLQRVGTSGAATIRVVVATPGTVDAHCRRVGLDTAGRLSCWDGRRAMLNLTRWNTGVSPFHADLSVYRPYLVSHEFGHGLGFGHVSCPGSGQLAPVMSQQSKGLGGCVANGWPYP